MCLAPRAQSRDWFCPACCEFTCIFKKALPCHSLCIMRGLKIYIKRQLFSCKSCSFKFTFVWWCCCWKNKLYSRHCQSMSTEAHGIWMLSEGSISGCWGLQGAEDQEMECQSLLHQGMGRELLFMGPVGSARANDQWQSLAVPHKCLSQSWTQTTTLPDAETKQQPC